MSNQPNWQPLENMALITSMIDGTLENTKDQYKTLQPAKDRPGVLDNVTVERIEKLYTNQLNDQWLFEEQLSRWEQEQLTAQQKQEIERLKQQLHKTKELSQTMVALSKNLKKITIESIMSKSDEEIAMDVLLGKLKL